MRFLIVSKNWPKTPSYFPQLQMASTSIQEKILNELNKFITKGGRSPNLVYLGQHEVRELRKVFRDHCRKMPFETEPSQIPRPWMQYNGMTVIPCQLSTYIGFGS